MGIGTNCDIFHAVEIVVANIDRALLVIKQRHVNSRLSTLLKLHVSVRHIDDLIGTRRALLMKRERSFASAFTVAARVNRDLDVEKTRGVSNIEFLLREGRRATQKRQCRKEVFQSHKYNHQITNYT